MELPLTSTAVNDLISNLYVFLNF